MNETLLPEPLVPAEVDLRDFQYMELDVRVLRDSRFAAQVTGDAFRAGVLLWCAAWHQVPAGSLPDDDIELANLAGYGRFHKEWRKVRAEALTQFVKCSDGRLYHETVCEKAAAAWTAKLMHHYDRARDRLRKANKARASEGLQPFPELTFEQWNAARLAGGIPMEKADASAGIPLHDPSARDGIPPNANTPAAGIPPENALKGRGNGEGKGTEREKETSLSAPVGADATASPAPPPVEPPPSPAPAKTAAELTKAELWTAGKSLLAQQGMPTAQCGTFVGKLVKDFGDGVVIEAVRAAVVEQPADAASFLKAACKARAAQRGAGGRQSLTDAERAEANARSTAEAKRALFGDQQQEVIDHA